MRAPPARRRACRARDRPSSGATSSGSSTARSQPRELRALLAAARLLGERDAQRARSGRPRARSMRARAAPRASLRVEAPAHHGVRRAPRRARRRAARAGRAARRPPPARASRRPPSRSGGGRAASAAMIVALARDRPDLRGRSRTSAAPASSARPWPVAGASTIDDVVGQRARRGGAGPARAPRSSRPSAARAAPASRRRRSRRRRSRRSARRASARAADRAGTPRAPARGSTASVHSPGASSVSTPAAHSRAEQPRHVAAAADLDDDRAPRRGAPRAGRARPRPSSGRRRPCRARTRSGAEQVGASRPGAAAVGR